MNTTTLKIDRIAFGGAGVGRLESGKVCFVPFTAPGELVDVRVTRERKSYAEAEVVQVREKSPQRVEAPCRYFGRCGGCQYQHLTYALQLEIKHAQVVDALRRIGGLDEAVVEPVTASPLTLGYRNRVTAHTRRGETGFYARGSREVVGVEQCMIASAAVNERLEALRASRPQDGEYPLREEGEFRGFRQVNEDAAALLLNRVEEVARPGGEHLIDAYCGGGFFASRLAPLFNRVTGIEWSAGAVRYASTRASSRETYVEGDVALHLADTLALAPSAQTCVLLDPPAEGLPEAVVSALLARLPARVIYVSCDPATMSRDIARLSASFRFVHGYPIDMFPHTAQIECVSVLECRP